MTPDEIYDKLQRFTNTRKRHPSEPQPRSLFDSGVHEFASWCAGKGMPQCWYDKVGPFNPTLDAIAFDKIGGLSEYITAEGFTLWKQGWEKARAIYYETEK